MDLDLLSISACSLPHPVQSIRDLSHNQGKKPAKRIGKRVFKPGRIIAELCCTHVRVEVICERNNATRSMKMKKEFIKSLDASGIRFIRVLWCDNANIIRGKAIHRSALERHFEHGVGISCAQQSIPAMFDAVTEGSGLGPIGEVRLIPDWETFVPLPYAPGHGRVLGNMVQKGEPWSYCPRDFLKRMATAAWVDGLQMRTAFENEFYLLLQTDQGIVPVDNTPFASTLSMDINEAVVGNIVDALHEQGISVEQYYPESGPGQQEISILHTNPLEAADHQVSFRETVHAVAHKHGVKASFLPKIFADKSGSGCHIHMSLWADGKSIIAEPKAPHKLGERTRAFIAGILHHLPSLMAITTPTTNSYRRILPHLWSGAYRCWGYDNREAAIRVITDPETGLPGHFEFKVVDATSNPYLALGAIIAAGLDGIRQKLEPGNPVDVDPGNLSDAERKKRRIEALPTSLGETIENLSRNEVLMKALGEDLARAYLAVKRAEYKHMKGFQLKEEIDLLVERY
jgi:glutamine synthetase